MSILRQVDLATNDTGRDAWGRPKAIIDNSIFHGMFTYNVPIPVWEESLNGTVQAFANATSENGKLVLASGATLNDLSRLRTYRNPRYEPNRGHLYSTSIFLPAPTAAGARRFGFFTAESGCYFEADASGLYGVVRTTIDAVTTEDRYLIDTTGVDLTKGNVYDIQMQWRGVGNYKFYINLTLVKEIEYQSTLDELSSFNPAAPVAFESENLGANVDLVCGCVDVTSEGGKDNGKTYGSVGISNLLGQVLAPADENVPIIAIRSKLTVGGLINTRDTLALLATAYSDQNMVFRIWATRDFTAIVDGTQTWSDFGDGHLEYVEYEVGGTPVAFTTAQANLIFTGRLNANESYATSALFEGRTSIYLTPGDMFIFTLHRTSNGTANVGVTFEFAEEI